ncbi:MAG: disulfide bond formation protein B [Proteobacteria bacterium]|nr:disulfide bond formation protein B [Pseudomonadota bacterium]
MMRKLVSTFFALPPRVVIGVFAAGSLALVGMAFVLEYGFGALPCHMCWLQRYGHWAMAGIATVSFVLPRLVPPLWGLAGTLAAAGYGLYVAVYQILVQNKILPLPEGCASAGLKIEANVQDFLAALQHPVVAPSCDRVDFTLLGFSLAEWNTITMLGVLVVGGVFLCRWYKNK